MRTIPGAEYVGDIPPKWRELATEPHHSGYATTKIQKTDYGYKIHRFSHHISLQTIRYEIYDDGFSKAIVKVDTNYNPRYQYTLYFHPDPITEIVRSGGTRSELASWKSMRAAARQSGAAVQEKVITT